MKPYVTALLTTALMALGAGAAWAQDVLVEGPGVKVGEATVLHPRVGIEAGVVSNVFFEEDSERFAPIMRLLAGLDISNAEENRLGDTDEGGAPTVQFKGGVELEYQEYLSDVDAVRDQRHLDVNAIGDLHFFPKSNASFRLQDKFQRIGRPTNFESSENLTRDINHFIATVGFHPRARTLAVHARYENIIDVFESDEAEFANRIQHIAGAKTTWKFYPYSQLYLDGSIGFYGSLGDNQLLGMDYKVGSNPLRLIAGIDSVLTVATTVKAYAGYANGFYDAGPSYSVPVGGVAFGWRYAPAGKLDVGYSFDAHDSINSNYYTEHHARIGVTQGVREVISLTGGASMRWRGYRGIAPQLMPSEEDRDDAIVEFNARAAWMIRDQFSLYADYLLHLVETDFRTELSAEPDDPSFIRHEFVVGAVAAF